MRNTKSMYFLAVVAGFALAACGDDTTEPPDSAVDAGDGGVDRRDAADAADAADTRADVAADTAADAVGDAAADGAADAAVMSATIIIGPNKTFTTTAITVSPGATVTVQNNDTEPHTVTSETAANDFTPGAVAGVSFDSGNIAAGASGTFVIPPTAPAGTVIPFYCKLHTSTMVPANGSVTVQ